MEGIIPSLVDARAEALSFYSPYNFLRALSAERQQELFGRGRALSFGAKPHEHIFSAADGAVQLLYSDLAWDSEFFGTRTRRLFTGLFDERTTTAQRAAAAQRLRQQWAAEGAYYAFAEVPTEDTDLLQLLTEGGWRLVETRLLFYHDQVAAFDHPRYPVRQAQPNEAPLIGQISAQARNAYDRFHADPWFGERGDAFLARYASAAVEGYCDAVLVPAEADLPVDAFLAISDLQADAAALGTGFSRVVLTAVGPQNRGWHLRLTAETVQRARALGHQYVLMTTQATNRAVFRSCEKLGFKLGGSSHVLACHAD